MNVPKTSGTQFQLMGPPAFPQSIFIESDRIEACMEYAQKEGLTGIAISPLGGFRLPNLSFLKSFPNIEKLTILHSEMIDISSVSTLKHLRYLQIEGKPKQPIDLRDFPVLHEFRADWWPKLQLGDTLPTLEILCLGHYAPRTGALTALTRVPELKDLELAQSSKLTLSGIDRFPSLRRLSVAYFPQLTKLSPLTIFRDSDLEVLEFENCKKLTDHDEVKAILSLKRLAFNSCGEIPSLRFLNDLPLLESFSFVGTNIVDGDLTPCLRLKFVGFSDKRHYSHRKADIKAGGSSFTSRA
jgi:protein phosphatase 1 regulatory subunit 7